MGKKSGTQERYPSLLHFNSSSSSILSHINPWLTLWWSAAFPGFGHFLIGNYVTGYIFVSIEIIVNNMAHINDAIYRTMIGDIQDAKEVLNLRWFFGYMGVYVFSFYDCYCRTVENNKVYLLSYRYTRKKSVSYMSPINGNIIDKTNPINGLFWSFLTPGLGSVFTHRTPTFVLALVWWGVTAVQSRWLEAIYYSAIGDFARAKAVLIPQWLLYIPSIMGFSMYYSYREAVVSTKRFKLSQAQYLKDAYQSEDFIKPV
jgi:hypothetical protein